MQPMSKWKKVENQTDGDGSTGVGLGKAAMDSDVVIVTANTLATSRWTISIILFESCFMLIFQQINVSAMPAASSDAELLANTLDPSRIIPQVHFAASSSDDYS